MPVCSGCNKDLARSCFSKSQLKKKGNDSRTCIECLNARAFRRIQPGDSLKIEDLLTESSPGKQAPYLRAAGNLREWCSGDTIVAFLGDSDRIRLMTITMVAALRHVLLHLERFVCGSPTLPAIETFRENAVTLDDSLADSIHKCTLCFALASSLLREHESDILLRTLTFICSADEGAPPTSILSLSVPLIATCASSLHKTTQYAIAMVSLILARQPTVLMTSICADRPMSVFMASTLYGPVNILHQLFHNTSEQRDGAFHYYGTGNAIALLPFLYHMGRRRDMWREGDYLKNFLHSAFSLIRYLAMSWGRRSATSTFALDGHHSVHLARHIFHRTKKQSWRLTLMDANPLAFALVGLLEVLAWWSWHGMFAHTMLVDNCMAWEVMLQLIPFFNDIIIKFPRLSYILPLVTAMANQETPPLPKASKSLLYGPLMTAHGRCALPSCRSPDDLSWCGGCELELYCCKEHQRAHWCDHKPLCLSLRRCLAVDEETAAA